MSDRIINLPDDVTEKILSCLSLREATRTSVLCSNWRYKSAMLQDLVFDHKSFLTQSRRIAFEDIVDHVLLLHIGPLRKFKLTYGPIALRPSHDIDRWVSHLSRNTLIEHLILDISIRYNLPSCLFSLQYLVSLELRRCRLLHPPSTSSRGFRTLKCLTMYSVTLSQAVTNYLLCSSPLLERVTMRSCVGFTILKIDAPDLLYINFLGSFQDVNLVNTSNLAEASIEYDVKLDQIRGFQESCSNLVKVFSHLPRIQKLTINWQFFKYLSIGALPEKLSKFPCPYLSVLSMDINFNDGNEVSTALCLLFSSPALRQLEITGRQQYISGANLDVIKLKRCLESLGYNNGFVFDQLRLVTLTKISGVKAEVDIIKFLLSSSPFLESMIIKPSGNCYSSLVKDLLRFRRSSMLAEIIYLDP